jgi:diaminopropionate ammonia-lyase
MKWAINTMPKSEDKNLEIMSLENVAKARTFHESFPQYTITPLANLAGMANFLGLGGLFMKDESYRFGLNAFKVLGGSFAMARYIADETGKDVSETTFDYLTSDQLQKDFGQATFFTATDGNHGRGVAWAANRLGQKAVVHMPKGSTQTRFDNIAKEGAKVTIEELNYDDCVRLAADEADATEHGVIVQDTAWDGYEKIPSWIMQGYGTMALEAAEQLRQLEVNRPTHVFVQAGVGSLASSMVGFFANLFREDPPIFVVMEAQAADCLYQGAVANDGAPRIVGGDLQTIMAGLACGEPNTIGWDILRNHVTAFLSCPDWVAAMGMRMLAAPVKGDPAVTSGESGAVGMGVVATIMTNPEYADLKEALKLDNNSKVLMFSTEGDTDPERYREIVWGGAFATE